MADNPLAGKNPYVGPKPFEIGQPLFGRDREVLELRYLLTSERIVLLYSPSGAGKSSLVNAGLIPKLQQRFEIWGPTRVNSQPPPDAPNRYSWSAISGLSTSALDPNITWTTHLARTPWNKNPLIIFDQFEEILRVDPVDTPVKRAFFEDLGDALSNPQIWALFILREDYLAPLDPFARLIPTHFQNRYRLDRLTRDNAIDAIEKPTANLPRKYFPGVAATLAQNLATVSVQHLDGTRTDEIGDYVEPLQLQVVCYDLWDRMRADDLSIDPEDVGDVGNALSNYYKNKLGEVSGGDLNVERRIRDWFNDQLITRDGVRNQVRHEPGTRDAPGQSGGLPNEFVSELVDTYIVRQEPRGGSTWYELAHDRLVPPIRQNNEEWFSAHLHKVQQRAVQWQKEEEPASLLLVDKDLEEAEQWASENTLQYSEERFLQACRAEQTRLDEKRQHEAEQRKYEEEQLRQAEEKRKEALRFRKLARFATAVGILAVLGMIGAIVLYFQAQSATDKANSATETANKEAIRASNAEREATNNAGDAEKQRIFAQDESKKLAVSLRDTNNALSRVAVEQAEQRANTRPGAALAFLDQALSYDPASILARSWITSLLMNASWYPDAILPEPGLFSPDGRILTRPSPTTIQFWDPQTHQRLGKVMDAGGPTNLVEFSPNGKTIVTTSGKIVRLWNADTQDRIAEHSVSTAVDKVVFEATGRYVATVDKLPNNANAVIQVWNTSTGAPVGKPINTVAPDTVLLSQDGLTALIQKGPISLGDVKEGGTPQPLNLNGLDLSTLVFDPAGNLLGSSYLGLSKITGFRPPLTGPIPPRPPPEVLIPNNLYAISLDGSLSLEKGSDLMLFDVAKEQRRNVIQSRSDATSAKFSPAGNFVTLQNEQGALAIYDVANKTLRESRLAWEDGLPDGLRQRINLPPVLLNSAGTFLLSGPAREKLPYLSKGPPQDWEVRTQPRNEAYDLAYDAEGHLLLLGTDDLLVRDSETGRELRRFEDFRTLSSNQRYALIASADGFLQVREVASGAPVGKRMGPLQGLQLTALSPDARHLVTVSQTSNVFFWDVQSGQSQRVPYTITVTGLAFSPDGKYFLTVDADRRLRQWDGGTGAGPLHEYLGDRGDSRLSPAISPDGSHFFTPADDSIERTQVPRIGARLWNTASSTALRYDFRYVYAFSPNGQRMLTSGAAGAQIRDIATNTPVGRIMAVNGPILEAAFGPNGNRVITMTNSAIQTWDADSGEPVGLGIGVKAPGAFALSPDGHQLAVLEGKTVKLTPVFLGSEAETDQLRAWAQAIGGFRITQAGSIQPIPFPDRLKLIQQLRQSASSAPPSGPSLASHLRRFFGL